MRSSPSTRRAGIARQPPPLPPSIYDDALTRSYLSCPFLTGQSLRAVEDELLVLNEAEWDRQTASSSSSSHYDDALTCWYLSPESRTSGCADLRGGGPASGIETGPVHPGCYCGRAVARETLRGCRWYLLPARGRTYIWYTRAIGCHLSGADVLCRRPSSSILSVTGPRWLRLAARGGRAGTSASVQ